MFYRMERSEVLINRSWLFFSPKTGRLYCFFCKLFNAEDSHFTEGFCDWKHAAERLNSHETSSTHLNSQASFKNLKKERDLLDMQLTKQIQDSTEYWRQVLRRVVNVIVHLGSRSLAFRGSDEILGSSNNGNFLGLIELLARYDEFLKKYLDNYGNCGSGRVNYLSSTVYEELIEIIGLRVFNIIIDRIKKAKFFSISLDGTSDAGHVDKLTIVSRYVEFDTPKERFLTFLPNQGHKVKYMYNDLVTFLNNNNLKIKFIRSQSYDNASPMSGKLNGLQALIKNDNILAIWVPCVTHSLNLVGEKASSSSSQLIKFFMLLQGVFVFFLASDTRWSLLVTVLKEVDDKILVPKRTDSTR